MRDAALIQVGSKYMSVAVQLLVTAILARLVTPEDFGVLAIVVVFSSFFSMFSDMGIGVAIVQFRDLDESDFGRLFGFSCILSICLASLFCLASLPISWMYGDERLIPMCCLASLSLLCSTLNMVPNGLVLREKKFKLVGLRLIVSTIVSGAAGIILALLWWGCYALVMQMVIASFVVLIWNLVSNPISHVTLHFMTSVRKVFSYSAFQFGFSLVNYFNRTLDNLLIGKLMGVASLGYYDKAYKLTTYPLTTFSSVVASVIQPYMAEHQGDIDLVFESWKKATKLFSIVGAAVAAIFFSCAGEIIVVIYGNQWEASIPIFQVLSVSIYAQMVGSPVGAFFQSLGRTDLLFCCGLINAGIMLVALLMGFAAGDLETLSWYVAAAFYLHLAISFYCLVRKAFGKTLSCLKAFIPEIGAGVLSGSIGVFVGMILPSSFAILFVGKLLTVSLVLLIVFLVVGDLKYLKALIK